MSTKRFKTFNEVKEWLYEGRPRTSPRIFKGEDGFEQSKKLLAGAGNPQNTHRAIHIAGTSGKGSTALILSNLLKAQGYRVGTLLSPHVYDMRERFLINCEFVAENTVVKSMNQLTDYLDEVIKMGESPSYYECMTLLGFQIVSNEALDFVVVETGLGGKLDTTNTITRSDKIAVLTQIGYDHTHILGDTLDQIAAQKAGIIQPGNEVIALRQDKAVNDIFLDATELQNARFRSIDQSILSTSMKSWLKNSWQFGAPYQQDNVALAYAALHVASNRDVNEDQIKQVLSKLTLPGRLERQTIGKQAFVFDGAHNTQKLHATIEYLKRKKLNLHVIFATGQRKDVSEMIEILEEYSNTIVLTDYKLLKSDQIKPAYNFAESVYAEKHPLITNKHELASYVNKIGGSWLVTGSFLVLKDVKDALIATLR